MQTNKMETGGYLFVPLLDEFFRNKRENVALLWVPLPCSLIFADELQHLCAQTKYIYVALMLTCGIRGKNELPFNIKYLAKMAGVDRRTMSKAIGELLGAEMLTKRERKTVQKEKTAQHTQTEPRGERADAQNAAVLCADSEFFSEKAGEQRNAREAQNGSENQRAAENQNGGNLVKANFRNAAHENVRSPAEGNFRNAAHGNVKSPEHRSEFSIEECLRYVEVCLGKGEDIKNANGLANHLFKTGEADAFIRAALYPQKQTEIDRAAYGEPRRFTNEPCKVCYGARMSDPDGRGYRKCAHCRDERGKATGLEPIGETNG